MNPACAASVANSRTACAYHLLRMGYRVPDARVFSRRETAAGLRYARGLGFPVIVKPDRASLGRGVALVHDAREYAAAVRAIFRAFPVAIVQRRAVGVAYRLVVGDGDLLAVYRRSPLGVVGDGKSTIAALLERRLVTLRAADRRLSITAVDPRVIRRLFRLGLSRRHVPASGERVALLETASHSTGGDAEEVTGGAPRVLARFAARLLRDLGLRFAAIDVIGSSSVETLAADCAVLDVNVAPRFEHVSMLGEAPGPRADVIYERVLRALLAG